MLVALGAQLCQDHLRVIADAGAGGVPRGEAVVVGPAVHGVDHVAADLQQLRIAVQADGAGREDVLDAERVAVAPGHALLGVAEDRLAAALLQREGAELVEDVLPLRALVGVHAQVLAHGEHVLEQRAHQAEREDRIDVVAGAFMDRVVVDDVAAVLRASGNPPRTRPPRAGTDSRSVLSHPGPACIASTR